MTIYYYMKQSKKDFFSKYNFFVVVTMEWKVFLIKKNKVIQIGNFFLLFKLIKEHLL